MVFAVWTKEGTRERGRKEGKEKLGGKKTDYLRGRNEKEEIENMQGIIITRNKKKEVR